MSDRGLAERIQQQVKVVEGGNDDLRAYNESEVERLLDELTFADLTHEEVITIHYTLAGAAGRKNLAVGGPTPGLRLLPQSSSADRPLSTG